MSLLLNKAETDPATTLAPRYASVNLIPPETLEKALSRKVAIGFGLTAAAVAVASAGIWTSQGTDIAAAESALELATVELAATRAQYEPLQPVNAFSLSVDKAKRTIGETMASELALSDTLQRFATAMPVGSQVRQMIIEKGTACAGPDPFFEGIGVGCVTWSVLVNGEREVRDLTAALTADKGLFGTYLTSAQRQDPQFEANGTVNIQPDALTHRYDALLNEVAQ